MSRDNSVVVKSLISGRNEESKNNEGKDQENASWARKTPSQTKTRMMRSQRDDSGTAEALSLISGLAQLSSGLVSTLFPIVLSRLQEPLESGIVTSTTAGYFAAGSVFDVGLQLHIHANTPKRATPGSCPVLWMRHTDRLCLPPIPRWGSTRYPQLHQRA